MSHELRFVTPPTCGAYLFQSLSATQVQSLNIMINSSQITPIIQSLNEQNKQNNLLIPTQPQAQPEPQSQTQAQAQEHPQTQPQPHNVPDIAQTFSPVIPGISLPTLQSKASPSYLQTHKLDAVQFGNYSSSYPVPTKQTKSRMHNIPLTFQDFKAEKIEWSDISSEACSDEIIVSSSSQSDDAGEKFQKITTKSAAILNLRTALCNADLPAVKTLIAQYPSLLNAFDIDSLETPLQAATKNGLLNIVQFLLSQPEIKVDHSGNDGATALHVACEQGQLLIAEALLAAGANAESQDTNKATPLMLACEKSKMNIVVAIIRHMNPRNIDQCDERDMTALHWVASSGSAEIATFLLKCGASHSSLDKYRMTPLCLAAAHNHLSVVKILLRHGAPINYINNLGMGAHHLACQRGHLDMLKLLMAHGAKFLKNGPDPVKLAATNGHGSVIHFLAQCGLPIDQSGYLNYTPLHAAALHGRAGSVQALIESGADMFHVNGNGRNALDEAIKGEDRDTILMLLAVQKEKLVISRGALKKLLNIANAKQDFRLINELYARKLESPEGDALSLNELTQ